MDESDLTTGVLTGEIFKSAVEKLRMANTINMNNIGKLWEEKFSRVVFGMRTFSEAMDRTAGISITVRAGFAIVSGGGNIVATIPVHAPWWWKFVGRSVTKELALAKRKAWVEAYRAVHHDRVFRNGLVGNLLGV